MFKKFKDGRIRVLGWSHSASSTGNSVGNVIEIRALSAGLKFWIRVNPP